MACDPGSHGTDLQVSSLRRETTSTRPNSILSFGDGACMKQLSLRLLLALGLFVFTTRVNAQDLDVRTYKLKNGLTILVHEDHTIPSVALYIFYRIGSRNERPGTTGLSHFFEHMMFNGARKYGPKQFDVTLENAGGSNNAYTANDVTVYQDWFPSSALELVFDLEADRIANLAFDPKVIESERGVVASERRASVEAVNAGLLSEQLWSTAFTAHPYQWPVVGWMVDIENWKMEDLRHHFEMGYSPSNATVVVAGDIHFEDVVRLATNYLEPIAAREPPPPVTTREPEQPGERRVVVNKLALLPLLMIGYHVPESGNSDYYALRVLEKILLFGNSSRLYQRLVDRDQLAIDVSGQMELAIDPTLFVITVQPRKNIKTATIERALFQEIDRVKDAPLSEREIQKARNALVAEFYRELRTINGKANQLGSYEIFFGDYRKLFTGVANYNRVTMDDVKRVAGKYFTSRNRTVGILLPDQPAAARKRPAGVGR
ncbi:MAG: pitrilysin family protein [Acidobacteriota bacterium]